MRGWQPLAIVVAIVFGSHNYLVQRAAGRIPDAWGALVLEVAAATTILVTIGALALAGHAPAAPRDMGGVALTALAGLFIGVGAVLYFTVFRLGAPLALAVPFVLTGWCAVAVGLGVALGGEVLAWRHVAGLACALLGIWFLR